MPEDFRPRGAREVRQAATAFLEMRDRITTHVEQRTHMLAGVSHDLRTVLTRFKLELALLGDTDETRSLQSDLREMQNMLEDYLAFAKGDGGDQHMVFGRQLWQHRQKAFVESGRVEVGQQNRQRPSPGAPQNGGNHCTPVGFDEGRLQGSHRFD